LAQVGPRGLGRLTSPPGRQERSKALQSSLALMALLTRWALHVLLLMQLLRVQADWFATTTKDQESAELLASKLRERFGKKIEHVHTVDVQSFYWWEDKVNVESEVRSTLDSEVPFVELREATEAIHPYDVPMIISAAQEKTLIASKEGKEKHLMAVFDLNETSTEDVGGLARELVDIRYVACAQVEALDEPDRHRVTLKTTGASKEQILREFGGLEFKWTPIRGNKAYLDYLDSTVVIGGSHGEL